MLSSKLDLVARRVLEMMASQGGPPLEEMTIADACTRYRGMIHAFVSMLGAIPNAQKGVDQVAAAIKAARV
jgi:hypothetical protein